MSETTATTGARDLSERGFSADVAGVMHGTNWDTVAATFLINLLSLVLPLTLMQVYDRIIPNAALNTLTFLVLGSGRHGRQEPVGSGKREVAG